MTNPDASVRRYEVQAQTSATFGRVLCSARNHHFVVDGPVQNGCPGEATTPAELFLSAVAACGAEVMQVIARDEGIPLTHVHLTVHGTVDRGAQTRTDVTVFTAVHLAVVLRGPDDVQAAALVTGFQRRCPLYGSLAVASVRIEVEYRIEAAARPYV
jgi:uncharacterized OsmC-like protein